MPQSIEILASAIHDAKNQIFFADNLAASLAERHDIEIAPLREAIGRVASRLTRALMAYRLESGLLPLSISAASVHGLIEDAVAIAHNQYAHLGLQLESHCGIDGLWPLDRDLVLDAISNALENAARYAQSHVIIEAVEADGMLSICVRDDGSGTTQETVPPPTRGLGLHIGCKIAELHRRHGRHGELRFAAQPGGGVFELRLP